MATRRKKPTQGAGGGRKPPASLPPDLASTANVLRSFGNSALTFLARRDPDWTAERDFFFSQYQVFEGQLRRRGFAMPAELVRLRDLLGRAFLPETPILAEAFFEAAPGERDLEMALQQLDRETWR